jgi:hypothetical protein
LESTLSVFAGRSDYCQEAEIFIMNNLKVPNEKTIDRAQGFLASIMEAETWRTCMLTVVWTPHGFHLIDVPSKRSKIRAAHHISRISSLLPEIFVLIKMTQRDILRFTLIMPDLIVPKWLLNFWITISFAEHFILLIRQIWPLRLLPFRVSERSAFREFIRRT